MLRPMSETFAGFRYSEIAGVPFLHRRDDRFKIFRLVLVLRRPLDERAAARSVLAPLLEQGTERDPGPADLARRREWLYGAAISASTAKLGESHVLSFSLDSVAGRFVPGTPDLLGGGLEFLADLALRPRLEGAGFPEEVFERVRREAADRARAVFDDKARYAAQRAIAEACAGEPFAIPEHGRVESIEALAPADPEAARWDFLVHGEMLAAACGALPRSGLEDALRALLATWPERAPRPVPRPTTVAPRRPGRTVERADLRQSKLVMILRTAPGGDDRAWAARTLSASLLGGGPHGRLFREVRERRSLAYYAHAGLDRYKGLLAVQVGLDESAAEDVEAEVLRQVGEVAAGRFSDDEMETARAGLLSSLAAVPDDVGRQLAFAMRRWLLGRNRSVEEHAALLASITREEVAAAAAGLWHDHTYLLAPAGAGEESA